jgi:nucleotide-binding universal stress UspA family protein
LVAYDGSSNALKAVEKAADLAKKMNASVTVINVCWDMSDNESYALLSSAKRFLDEADVRSQIKSIRSNNPSQAILNLAEDGKFDLIVVGSRGRGGTNAFLMGSVSTKIVQDAHCDVLVVKE